MQKRAYEKSAVQDYMQFCNDKATRVINAETDETLAAPSGFSWLKCTRAEVHVYNTRHIQHHAAQISLRLRLNEQAEIPWVRQGWIVE